MKHALTWIGDAIGRLGRLPVSAPALAPTPGNEQLFKIFADNVPQVAWLADPQGGIVYGNQRWFAYTGMTFEQSSGAGWQSAVHPDDLPLCLARWLEASRSGSSFSCDIRLRKGSDGSYTRFRAHAMPLYAEDGSIASWLGVSTNMNERGGASGSSGRVASLPLKDVIELQNEIVAAGLDLQAVMNLVAERIPTLLPEADGAMIYLRDGSEIVISAGSGRSTGTMVSRRLRLDASGAGLCMTTGLLVNVADSEIDTRVDLDACRKLKGRSFLFHPLMHAQVCVGVCSIFSDKPNTFAEHAVEGLALVSSVIAASMRHAALFEDAVLEGTLDAVTGLENRRSYDLHLPRMIIRANQMSEPLSVALFDLDDFKNVNDTLGHAAGDDVLKSFGALIHSSIRSSDSAFRTGGDEFVVLMPNCDAVRASAMVERMHCGPSDPESERRIEFSYGVAQLRDEDSVKTLIDRADGAMYENKRKRKGLVAPFLASEPLQLVSERLRVEGALRRAIETNAFALAYQPIFALDGTLVASEALVRWPQADGTVLQPGEFIPYAEECGQIVPLGTWILRTACRQFAQWNAGGAGLRVCVNVSAKQITDPGFVGIVQAALAESGLRSGLLELELTETAISNNPKRSAEVARDLRSMGVRISLDDFGTGYNSLAMLRSIEIDSLKLDRCFITDIAINSVDRAIAGAILFAARAMRATVIAEGVETPAQLVALGELGCDEVQGYLFSRPLDANAFAALLGALIVRPLQRALHVA